jgi:hypothetical protein
MRSPSQPTGVWLRLGVTVVDKQPALDLPQPAKQIHEPETRGVEGGGAGIERCQVKRTNYLFAG